MSDGKNAKTKCIYCEKPIKYLRDDDNKFSDSLIMKCPYCQKRFIYDWKYVFECSTKKIED